MPHNYATKRILTVAERIGTLDDRFLGRARPLGEARRLWESGPDGVAVRP